MRQLGVIYFSEEASQHCDQRDTDVKTKKLLHITHTHTLHTYSLPIQRKTHMHIQISFIPFVNSGLLQNGTAHSHQDFTDCQTGIWQIYSSNVVVMSKNYYSASKSHLSHSQLTKICFSDKVILSPVISKDIHVQRCKIKTVS